MWSNELQQKTREALEGKGEFVFVVKTLCVALSLARSLNTSKRYHHLLCQTQPFVCRYQHTSKKAALSFS